MEPTLEGVHVAFVVNVDWFFLSHRLPIAHELVSKGAKVTVIAASTGNEGVFSEAGIDFIEAPFSRKSKSPRELVRMVRFLRQVFRDLGPDLVHNVTVKPLLAGSVAARLHDPNLPVVNAISGFGHLLSDDEVSQIERAVTKRAYRMALRAPRRTRVIVQNDDARQVVATELARGTDVVLIPGMGVDPTKFKPAQRVPDGAPIVMLVSRMIATKGIYEFCAAASLVQEVVPGVRFVLVGSPDEGNPLAIAEDQLERLATGGVEWWGPSSDVANTLTQASVFVLPTYHEGLPKALVEAAATGLPIVATAIPGCRQVVRHRREALLVAPRCVNDLADAITELLQNAELSRQLGTAARERVLAEFTIGHSVELHLAVYRDLLAASGAS